MKKPFLPPKALLDYLRTSFALEWQGIHGVPHWARVQWNGLFLARHLRGVREDVVVLFAFLHDHCRREEGPDPDHGLRAAENATRLRGQYFEIDDEGFDLLCYAMIGHSDGELQAPLTVQVCWDADRLDLGRVGIEPLPDCLCTAIAGHPAVISRCQLRALRHEVRLTAQNDD